MDNRPGASGIIGAEAAARAPADGYTVLIGSPAEVAINQWLYPSMPYDPSQEFAPISPVADFPLMIVANASSPIKSFKGLVAFANEAKQGLAFATSGIGSMQHLVGEWLTRNAGIKLLHVPYKGTGPAMNDLLGGQVGLAIMGLAPLVPHIKEGKLQPLAVTSSERSPVVPDVPTLKELGYDFESTIWFGAFAPSGTPESVIQKIRVDLQDVMTSDDVRAQMVKLGGNSVTATSEEFEHFVSQERDKYSAIIKDADIKMQ